MGGSLRIADQGEEEERKAREREVDGRSKGKNDDDDGAMREDDEGEIVPDFDYIELLSESENGTVREEASGKRKLEMAQEEEVKDELEAMARRALREKEMGNVPAVPFPVGRMSEPTIDIQPMCVR